MSLNHITIMGRMTKDPELRRTNGGTPVTSFVLAVDRDFKPQNGEKETDFIEVVAWKAAAEFACKYFGKGRVAVVDGRLQVREWTDKDGNKRKTAEVIAEHMYFGDSKLKEDYGSQQSSGFVKEDYGSQQSSGFVDIEDDGDIPF